MKIQQIQPTDFQGKKRVYALISDNMRGDIQKLMYNMNHETKYEQCTNGNCFRSYITGALKIKERALFMDKRFLCAPTEKTYVLDYSDCSIEFGRNQLDINSQTGEAFVRKPFWKSLKQVIKQGHEYIKDGIENFDNAEVVEKRRIGICGVTEKGAKIIEDAKQKAGLG